MSFQGYLKTILEKTGLKPGDFRRIAEEKGFTENRKLKKEVKAAQVIAWLKEDYQLGHGHSMAIVALLKGDKDEQSA
ncbi:MAG: DUF4287 domain-containing protein [Chitinophagaceae bacterium]|nr:MAG: DUF4287 domain-containing protein [Chitinophagaceae bacterium]